MKKERIKTSVYFTIALLNILIQPFIIYINNNILILIHFIIQIALILKLYKRVMEG